MRLTALTEFKIEGDVLEEFVRHTLRFADRVIVVDRGSLDASREILGALVSEGLPVTLWEGEVIPRMDYRTALARRAFSAFPTDYLLLFDVDEFVRAPSRAAFEVALEALGGAHGLVPWTTYVPTPDDEKNEVRVLARVRHRLRSETRQVFKVIVHRSFMERPSARMAPGNHRIFDSEGYSASEVLPGIDLAHIPVRSLRQIQCKALLGWPMVLAMGFPADQGIAYQWRDLNERLVSNPQWGESEFHHSAWHYLDGEEGQPEFVLDPLPSVERRYHREPPELLALAIAYTRQLALVCADRSKSLSEAGR